MELDEEIYCQTKSIDNFLANKYGFSGKTPLEQLKIDMVQETAEGKFIAFQFRKLLCFIYIRVSLNSFQKYLSSPQEGERWKLKGSSKWTQCHRMDIGRNRTKFVNLYLRPSFLHNLPTLSPLLCHRLAEMRTIIWKNQLTYFNRRFDTWAKK